MRQKEQESDLSLELRTADASGIVMFIRILETYVAFSPRNHFNC
jgi:hypothetical protein